MAVRQIKPALQYSEGRSKPWSGAKLVNCFAEKADGDKQVDFAIMAVPGLDRFATIGTGPIRGAVAMGQLAYVVSGEKLYSVTSAAVVTELGDVPGYRPVRMVMNGAQVAIAAAPTGYVWDGSALERPVDLPQVSDVAYIDSYFVWSIHDSDQCIYSGIADGMSYDLLDVFTAEGAPDGLVGLVADHRELQLYGTGTVEIFYNAGGIDNVFERQGNAFIERGCFDRDSIAKVDNSVMFMGDDRIIYRLDGYTPIRLSTHAVEYRLRNVAWARAYSYTQEGHKFYVLNTDKGCLAYDMATGAWHERLSSGLRSYQNYRCGGTFTAWGQTYLTDNEDNRIFVPNLDRNDEDGVMIAVEVMLPTLEASRARVTMYAFEVHCETGVGLSTGQGSDPQIMMRYSDDGGRTWSTELSRSMGRIGDYKARAIWRRLGQFRQRDINLRVTDSVRRLIMSYYADVR